MGSRSEIRRSRLPSESRGPTEETVLVGRVLRPHGLRGEVKIEVLSDVPDRFEIGRELWLIPGDGKTRERVRIACFRARNLIRFEGYEYRDQAESLRGSRLEVGLSEVPDAPPGAYYHHDLIGCRCVESRHGDLGKVVAVVEDGGGDLLEVESETFGSLLVPFVETFLVAVDLDRCRIDLELPPGLVEVCASSS